MRTTLACLALLSAHVAVAADRATSSVIVDVGLNEHPAPSGTRIFVHRPRKPEAEVAQGWPGEPIPLPAGVWTVRAVVPGGPLGPIEVAETLLLRKAERRRIRLVARHAFGFLRVDARTSGVRPDEAGAMAFSGDDVKGNGISLVLGQAEPLPVGRYTLVVTWLSVGGIVEKRVSGVEVAFEETWAQTVDLGPSGVLNVDVQGLDERSDATVELFRAGERVSLSTLPRFEPYRVPEGRYDLRVVQHVPVGRVWERRSVRVRDGEDKLVIIPAQ